VLNPVSKQSVSLNAVSLKKYITISSQMVTLYTMRNTVNDVNKYSFSSQPKQANEAN